MTDAERDRFIDKIIANKQKEEEKKQRELEKAAAANNSELTGNNQIEANVAIGIKGFEGSAHFIHQLVIQRIELLGAIQGDDANAGLCGDGNEFVGHDGIEKKKNGERII